MSAPPRRNFITAAALAEALQGGAHPVLLDIRFDPGRGAQPARYLQGHLPGAHFVSLPEQLADTSLEGRGANPLPDLERLQEAARAWGLTAESEVVVYDDTTGGPAGRAWWVLRWAGLPNVRILEGGLAAWKRAGFALEEGEAAAAAPGNITLRAGGLPHLEAGEVLDFVAQGTLIDARPRPDFSGEGKKHIPGARSLPASALLDAEGALLPPDRLRAVLAESGVDLSRPVAAYCGGGVASTFLLAALSELGTEAALYPGSWSEWTADPSRPVEA
nr:sulfurtransferase [uncultured Roseococcus sp.]